MATTCKRCGSPTKPGDIRCASCGEQLSASAGWALPQRPAQRRAFMTELASQAFDLSDTFNVMFEDRFVGHKLTLAKPGMSTEGGKQAVQHIVLQAQDGASLVVGSVDGAARRAGIRAYERVRTAHQTRFHSDFTIQAADWYDFAAQAEAFFREEGLEIRHEPISGDVYAVEQKIRVPAGAGRGVPMWLALVLAGVLVAIAVGITIFVLRRTAPVPAANRPTPTWPAAPSTPVPPSP